MLTPFLTAYCARASSAIAFVQTPRDVLPTRERSVQVVKSLFPYRSCHARTSTTQTRRGESPVYIGSIFGEVKSVERLVRGFVNLSIPERHLLLGET
jgi:hypothetical protein